MNNYFWLVVLPNLDCFFGILGCMGMIFCIIGFLVYLNKKIEAYQIEDHKKAGEFAKTLFKVLGGSMIMFFMTCFIPSKKDLIQLKMISVIAELKGVEQIPQKLIDRLNNLLDESHDVDSRTRLINNTKTPIK